MSTWNKKYLFSIPHKTLFLFRKEMQWVALRSHNLNSYKYVNPLSFIHFQSLLFPSPFTTGNSFRRLQSTTLEYINTLASEHYTKSLSFMVPYIQLCFLFMVTRAKIYRNPRHIVVCLMPPLNIYFSWEAYSKDLFVRVRINYLMTSLFLYNQLFITVKI